MNRQLSYRNLARLLRTRRRGAAMIIALALIMVMTIVIAGTHFQTVNQLRVTRADKDFERALQMAEAGLNAYMNRIANGSASGTNSSLIGGSEWPYSLPNLTSAGYPAWSATSCLSVYELKKAKGEGRIPAAKFIAYPTGQTKQGFFVGHAGNIGSSFIIYSYGFCNGVMRRIQGTGHSFNIFDWAALWGLNTDTSGKAWDVGGSFRIIGAFGGEGNMYFGNATEFYYGDSVLSGPNATFYLSPSSLSTPNLLGSTPSGVSPYDPPYSVGLNRTLARPITFPTADGAANQQSGTSQGVEYFRTHNNNLTGIRYLVTNGSIVLELTSTAYTVTGKNNKSIATAVDSYSLVAKGNGPLANPGNSNLTSWGMPSGFSFYGVRVYPGDYFFEEVESNTGNPILEFRSFNDRDITSTTMTASPGTGGVYRWPRTPIVYDAAIYNSSGGTTLTEPLNPNKQNYLTTGSSIDDQSSTGPQNIRFWIGHNSATTNSLDKDAQSAFGQFTNMEWPQFPSRFRAYISSNTYTNKPIVVNGNGSSSAPFNTNILVYNSGDPKGNGGSPYGYIGFNSSTWLRGSLIAWNVASSNGGTVQKIAPEAGPNDVLSYVLDTWTELK